MPTALLSVRACLDTSPLLCSCAPQLQWHETVAEAVRAGVDQMLEAKAVPKSCRADAAAQATAQATVQATARAALEAALAAGSVFAWGRKQKADVKVWAVQTFKAGTGDEAALRAMGVLDSEPGVIVWARDIVEILGT